MSDTVALYHLQSEKGGISFSRCSLYWDGSPSGSRLWVGFPFRAVRASRISSSTHYVGARTRSRTCHLAAAVLASPPKTLKKKRPRMGPFLFYAPGVGFEPTTKWLQGTHRFHDGLDYLITHRNSVRVAGARGEFILVVTL